MRRLRRILDGLANRLGHLGSLTQTHADMAVAVADDDQCAEVEAFAALDHLGHAADLHDRLFEI